MIEGTNQPIKTLCKHRRASGKLGSGVFMALPLPQQEGVGQANQGDVMMPALPAAPFVVVQSQFLFQLLIVLFDSPAQFGQLHQAAERDPLGLNTSISCFSIRPVCRLPTGSSYFAGRGSSYFAAT